MKNIKTLLMVVVLLLSGAMLKAQEMTFEQMMPVRVLMPTYKDIKGDALTVLYNNINEAVTLNGLGSSTNESRFIIVSSVTVLSKTAIASIPPQYRAEVEVAFYFVDNINKIILSQEIINKRAMADNENKAVANAIKSIKARDPKFKKLITLGKQRAIEYYKAIDESESQNNNGDPDVSWVLEEDK